MNYSKSKVIVPEYMQTNFNIKQEMLFFCVCVLKTSTVSPVFN